MGGMSMEARISFTKPTDQQGWALQWTQEFLEQVPAGIEIESARIAIPGRNQISLEMRLCGRSTAISLDGDKAGGPEHRAATFADWVNTPEQQALFDQADALRGKDIRIERAGALSAAEKVDGATFAEAVRRFETGSTAKVRRRTPNIVMGRSVLEVSSALSLRRRPVDGSCSVRLRSRWFTLTHLTFTPKVEMVLPAIMLDSLPGRLLEEVIDAPILTGGGLVIAKVWSNPALASANAPARTSFEVCSDMITLDEAIDIIDARRATRKHAEEDDE